MTLAYIEQRIKEHVAIYGYTLVAKELEQVKTKLLEVIGEIEALPARETIMGDKQVFVESVLDLLRRNKDEH